MTALRAGLRRAGALLALFVVLGASSLLTGASDPSETEPSRRELMGQIVEEEDVVTERHASPLAYLGHVYETLLDRLVSRFSESPAMLAASRIVVWAVVILAAGVLAWVLGSTLYGALRRGRAPEAPGPSFEREVRPVEDPRAAFESARSRQDAAAALHALWRWVALELGTRAGARVHEGATYREILGQARRTGPDREAVGALGRLARASERWLYRGEPFSLDEVVAMREALGGWLR